MPDSKNVLTPRPKRSWWLVFNAFVRWSHIYLSMGGFFSILFFSFTGITLNHPNWFGGGRAMTDTLRGQLPAEWVALSQPSESPDGEAADSIDRLRIAEYLRDEHRLRGKVGEFRINEDDLLIAFRGPGYSADVFLDRKDGRYEISLVDHGFLGKWNDLHKGRDSGWVWSILIDLSAVVMIVSSLTGLVMLFFLKRKRASGLATAAFGVLFFLAFYLWVVP